MWTEDEHRLFLDGYKARPRDWSYLAKIVTSKTPTQIRTHAYSVFQRRRRVGTPLPSGFENMVSKNIKNEKSGATPFNNFYSLFPFLQICFIVHCSRIFLLF